MLKVIAGCKSDAATTHKREVSKEEGQTFAIGHNARYWEGSAKDEAGAEAAEAAKVQPSVFESLAASIMALKDVSLALFFVHFVVMHITPVFALKLYEKKEILSFKSKMIPTESFQGWERNPKLLQPKAQNGKVKTR